MTLNIAIRTLVITEGDVYFQVGGGIVVDSSPEDEYLETAHKAKRCCARSVFQVADMTRL